RRPGQGMTATGTALALFGGTFDPVHTAHLHGARTVADVLRCPVHLLPNAVPPHRPQPLASGAQRLTMLQRACDGQPDLIPDDWELRQRGPSWSLNTLRHFRTKVGPHRPLVLVIGADSLASLHQWHRWQDYPALCHLAVLPRPGASEADIAVRAAFIPGDASDLLRRPAGRRLVLGEPGPALSATGLREALARAGHSAALPPAVEAYIREQGLYNVPDRSPQSESGNA